MPDLHRVPLAPDVLTAPLVSDVLTALPVPPARRTPPDRPVA